MTALKATDIPKLLFQGLFNTSSKAEPEPQPEEPKIANPGPTESTVTANITQGSAISEVTSILCGIPEPIAVLDLNNQVLIFNEAAEALLGYKSADAVGKPINKLIQIYKNDQEILENVYTQNSYSGTDLTLVSSKTLSEKSNLLVNLSAHKVQDHQQFGIGSVLTFYNLTQERKLEEMKMNFVSVAAHELRTPITSIKGYLSVYMEENAIKLNEDQKELLGQIEVNVKRLETLIENLLNVSRIERGTITIQLEQLDLVEIVKQCVEEFKKRAMVKEITLEFMEPKQALPKVKVDKVRILEVLSNLIGNAINYTSPHGQIKVSMELTDKELITHIADTGIGIPKEALPRLFTKFYRVSEGLTVGQNPSGTGLGLFVSKSIIEMHHGRIWAQSELGKGSVFSFAIPIV